MSNISTQSNERETYTFDKHAQAIKKCLGQYGEMDDLENAKSAASKWLGMRDHLETASADKLVGGELWVKPGASGITTYNSKTISPGNAIKSYKAGSYIGIVESYVTNPNMLMTTDKQFVPIDGSNFDKVKMDASLAKNKAAVDKIIADKVAERKANNTSTFYKAGTAINETVDSAISMFSNLKWYVLGVGVLIALVLAYKITK
jgi:hypothetical protein